jgi:hypothetical protein
MPLIRAVHYVQQLTDCCYRYCTHTHAQVASYNEHTVALAEPANRDLTGPLSR